MPIGWVREGAHGVRERPAAPYAPVRSSFLRQIAATVTATARAVEAASQRAMEPQAWTRWETASDEKVCPICGPYAGRAWRAEEGPQPPLHPQCRCRRVYAFTTWSVRS